MAEISHLIGCIRKLGVIKLSSACEN